MGYFHTKVNGETRKFSHHQIHKANCRQVALRKWKENQKELFELKDISAKQLVNIFETGFNMGYKEAINRVKDVGLEQKDGKLNLCTTHGAMKRYSPKP